MLKGSHMRATWSLNGILISHIVTRPQGCSRGSSNGQVCEGEVTRGSL